MRKTFFLGVGRWLTAAVIGFFLLRMLFSGGSADVPFETVTNAVVQTVDLSETKTADAQMVRRLYGLDPAEFDGCLLYYPNTNMGAEELLLVRLRSTAQQDAVSAAVEARLAAQRSSFDGYGVEQMELLSRCVVEIRGNYVLFVVGADAQAVRQAFLDAL